MTEKSNNPLSTFAKLSSDLEACYNKVKPEDYEKLSYQDKYSVCKDIREKMQNMMANNEF